MACALCSQEGSLWEWRGVGYCDSCWSSYCACCKGWAKECAGNSADGGRLRCHACDLLTAPEREELASLGRVLAGATFQVWKRGTRERADDRQEVPVAQPARVRPWLCVGDLDDVRKLADGELADRGISQVLLLCKDHLRDDLSEEALRAKLETQGVLLETLDAADRPWFDIVGYAKNRASEVGTNASAAGGCVLVNCYGGVNRAGAVSVMMLMLVEGVPLLEAAAAVVRGRGVVLKNVSFRRQLVQLASTLGLLSGRAAMTPASATVRSQVVDADAESAKTNVVATQGETSLLHGTVQASAAVESPCSWMTRKDATVLLELLSMAVAQGAGEDLKDKRGYTLGDWEAWSGRARDSNEIEARVDALRSVLSRLRAAPSAPGDAPSGPDGSPATANSEQTQGPAPCSWGTKKDPNRLLGLVALALHAGCGEDLKDKRGYTLRDWEQYAEEAQSESERLRARISSVRRLLA